MNDGRQQTDPGEACPQHTRTTLSFATLVKSMTHLKSARIMKGQTRQSIPEIARSCEEQLSDCEKSSENDENSCQHSCES